jgi:hypothetical protein
MSVRLFTRTLCKGGHMSLLVRNILSGNSRAVELHLRKQRLPKKCGKELVAAMGPHPRILDAVLAAVVRHARRRWHRVAQVRASMRHAVRSAAMLGRVAAMTRVLDVANSLGVRFSFYDWQAVWGAILRHGSKELVVALLAHLTRGTTLTSCDQLPFIMRRFLEMACALTQLRTVRQLLSFCALKTLPLDLRQPLQVATNRGHTGAIRALSEYKYTSMY